MWPQLINLCNFGPGMGSLLPYALNPSGLADGALPAGWTGATWAVATGAIANTPTDVTNKVGNPELTTDMTGYVAESSAILSRVDSALDPGTVSPGADAWCLKVAYNGTANPGALGSVAALSVTAGQWYRVLVLAFAPSGNTAVNAARFIPSGALGGGTFSVTAEDAWQTLCNRIARATGTTTTMTFRCPTSSAGDVAYFDKYYVAQVSGLVATRNAGRNDVIVKGAWTIPANFHAGVIALSDGTMDNCLLAYHDRTNAYLLQYVGGVVGVLASGAAAYAAGRVVEIQVSSGGTVAKLYYNNVQIGADQTPNAAIRANTQCGLFSTGSATCSLFTVVAN